MNLKQKMKNFFTLTRKADSGFTLVELIVVIAILAILGGVAVPAYSGYVKKANMQADMTLVSEVINALTLHYYGNINEAVDAAVILTGDEAFSVTGGEYVDEAMSSAFGDGWKSLCTLKWDGWTSDASKLSDYFTSSSFSGKEEELMGTVDGLSEALSAFIESYPGVVGDNFAGYLTENGIELSDTTTSSDAAVLYIADTIDNMSDTQKEAVVGSLNSIGETYVAAFQNNLGLGMTPADAQKAAANTAIGNASSAAMTNSGNILAACAILYAYAEAYCQNDSEVSMPVTFTASTAQGVLREIEAAFVTVMTECTKEIAYDYFGLDTENGYVQKEGTHQSETDAWAVISSMEVITDVSDKLVEDIKEDDFSYAGDSTVALVNNFLSAAESSIVVAISENGVVSVSPEDYMG